MATPRKDDTDVNCIARSQGTDKVAQVYYSPKAPHNQPFFRYAEAVKKV